MEGKLPGGFFFFSAASPRFSGFEQGLLLAFGDSWNMDFWNTTFFFWRENSASSK